MELSDRNHVAAKSGLALWASQGKEEFQYTVHRMFAWARPLELGSLVVFGGVFPGDPLLLQFLRGFLFSAKPRFLSTSENLMVGSLYAACPSFVGEEGLVDRLLVQGLKWGRGPSYTDSQQALSDVFSIWEQGKGSGTCDRHAV